MRDACVDEPKGKQQDKGQHTWGGEKAKQESRWALDGGDWTQHRRKENQRAWKGKGERGQCRVGPAYDLWRLQSLDVLVTPYWHDLSQVNGAIKRCWWHTPNKYNGNGTSPVGFLPKPIKCSLVGRKAWDKPKPRDIPPAPWPALLKLSRTSQPRTRSKK